jgi:ribonuclease P protein component
VDSSVSDTPKGRFPKSEHLRKHSDFQRVYQQGRRHFSGNMTVFYLRTGDLPTADAVRTFVHSGAEAGHRDAAAAAEPPMQAATAMASCRLPQRGIRIGFTVSKALGGAVERNRMRRRTREAVRHHLFLLEGMSAAVDVVINPKKSLLRAEFSEISQEIARAFTVIRRACGRGCEGRTAAEPTTRAAAGGTTSTRREARPR